MDFVVIATPMSQYEKVIPHLNKHLSKKSLITDVGSTKENISKLKNINDKSQILRILQ